MQSYPDFDEYWQKYPQIKRFFTQKLRCKSYDQLVPKINTKPSCPNWNKTCWRKILNPIFGENIA